MNISSYKKYISEETMMGPNSVRILAELLDKYPLQLADDDLILDLGCGTGLTSFVIAKETRAKVYANDLWVSAEENRKRFAQWAVWRKTPVKTCATTAAGNTLLYRLLRMILAMAG